MHKIRTAIFVLDMLPIHRQLDMCFAHEKSADCAKDRRGVCFKEAPKAKALGEASPAEVCAEFVVTRPEGVHRYVERAKTEKVNKKFYLKRKKTAGFQP